MSKFKWTKDPGKVIDKIQKKLKNKQKSILRKILKPLKAKVKADAPKQSGALGLSIGTKVDAARKGKGAVFGLVGVRTKYSKNVKGKLKIPNKYAQAIDELTQFMSGQDLGPYLEQMEREFGDLIRKEMA